VAIITLHVNKRVKQDEEAVITGEGAQAQRDTGGVELSLLAEG